MNNRILPSVALLIAIGIFFAYVHPTWNGSIAATKAAIELDNQALIAAEEYKQQENMLATARAAINPDDLTRLETFLPDSVDNVRLILDLNALAARSGLSLTNIDVVTNNPANPGASQTGLPSIHDDPIGSVNLSMTALGTFSALQTFLQRVEMSARLLDVQKVVVKSSETGVYTYDLSLRLYWLH